MSSDAITAISSSLDALTKQYRTITHNIANANTAGYKRRRSVFEETLQKQVTGGAAAEAVGASSAVDYTQGRFVQTDRPLDLALNGDGFFVVEGLDGPIYTRNGTFRINEKRQLVDFAGRLVAGDQGPIVLPPTASALAVRVSQDGSVGVDGRTLGRLRLVEFEDRKRLIPDTGTGYRAPDDLGAAPAKKTSIQQGFQESANVSVIEEMVGLIAVSRMYEANMKTISQHDDKSKHLLNVALS